MWPPSFLTNVSEMNLRPYVFWNEVDEASVCVRDKKPVLGRRSAVERDRVVVAEDALERDFKTAVGRRAANMLETENKGSTSSTVLVHVST